MPMLYMRTLLLVAVSGVGFLVLGGCRSGVSKAVDRCIKAVRSTAVSGGPRSRAGEIAWACADLFKEPACRDAHRRFDEPGIESRASTLARRCRDAYCPRLPQPQPTLCQKEPANSMELAESWQEFVHVVYQRDLGVREAERLISALQSAGRGNAERLKHSTSSTPTQWSDAMLAISLDEKLRTARDIREVVQQYLHTSPEKARSQLPSDWAPMLPLVVGAVEADPDGRVRIGGWHLNLEGEQAQLDYYPAGSITAKHRIWFRIQLARQAGQWEILPPGASFAHAWAKER